ncbi:hypothetical protein PPERSA_09943 [Pseudocohnilembus persalinus]|uniref:CHY-type domain-containing protein n=1 Tax=Pseudocohnilembus persalinus TaxID=266149 RepID=A0A0V0QJF7_PSEPJ|nr:hypothetical protein PPERSA_09943 [Pseudocohnilembus persalinus]|eukprot:KRX02326.1 hypothetical protein PPERSA_09943 [Pseudocohnilembus persalinus]
MSFSRADNLSNIKEKVQKLLSQPGGSGSPLKSPLKSSLKRSSTFQQQQHSLNQSSSSLQRSPSKNVSLSNTRISGYANGNSANLKQSLKNSVIVGGYSKSGNKRFDQRFGLTLERVCTIPEHAKGKLEYVCVLPDCKLNRYGCERCFQEEHEHHNYCKQYIDDFLQNIEKKEQNYLDSVQHYQNLSDQLETPQFLDGVFQNLDTVKEIFSSKIENIKFNIAESYKNISQNDKDQIISDKDEQAKFLEDIYTVAQKNVYELNEDEFEVQLNLLQEVQQTQLMDQILSLQQKKKGYANLFFKFSDFITESLTQALESDFARLPNIEGSTNDIHRLESQTQAQIQSYQQNIREIEQAQIDYKENQIKKSEELKTQKEVLEQQLQEIQQPMNTQMRLEKLKKKKQEISDLLKQASEVMPILQDVNRGIQILEKEIFHNQRQKDYVEKLQTSQLSVGMVSPQGGQQVDGPDVQHYSPEKSRLNDYGDFDIFKNPCEHIVECNTVPIFNCCGQAYRCAVCHDQHATHKSLLQTPSQRYCLDCFKTFTVNFCTNIPINCSSCVEPKGQVIENIKKQHHNVSQQYLRSPQGSRVFSEQESSPKFNFQ